MTVTLDPATISPVNVGERKDLGLRAGDTVRIHQKIQEKGKTRIQVYEGLVIARKHGSEPGATFTVRATLSGVGVEKIFPLYSPLIDKIEVIRRSKVRRAKLYYIREKVARDIRRGLRNMRLMSLSTESEREVLDRQAAEAAAAADAAAAEAAAAPAESETPVVQEPVAAAEEEKKDAA